MRIDAVQAIGTEHFFRMQKNKYFSSYFISFENKYDYSFDTQQFEFILL